ncbi:MAG: outer membrane beta-barrel protein [Candidatus Latescibacteria bacterium]|nr:outer membrane beta-barrel protein [Candidatus Latescibacterota bacterium]
MKQTRRRAAGVAVLGVLLPLWCIGDAGAGAGRTEREAGFFLGLGIHASLIGAEDPPPGDEGAGLYFDEAGPGLSIGLGYAFTPGFALKLAVAGARHETNQPSIEAAVSTAVLEAQVRLAPREPACPYLIGGLGGAAIRVDTGGYDSEVSGGVAVLGAGMLLDLTANLHLDLSARLDLINWDTVKVIREAPGGAEVRLEAPVDDSGSAAKLEAGLVWRF